MTPKLPKKVFFHIGDRSLIFRRKHSTSITLFVRWSVGQLVRWSVCLLVGSHNPSPQEIWRQVCYTTCLKIFLDSSFQT
jgi:hypothetical protein